MTVVAHVTQQELPTLYDCCCSRYPTRIAHTLWLLLLTLPHKNCPHSMTVVAHVTPPAFSKLTYCSEKAASDKSEHVPFWRYLLYIIGHRLWGLRVRPSEADIYHYRLLHKKSCHFINCHFKREETFLFIQNTHKLKQRQAEKKASASSNSKILQGFSPVSLHLWYTN